MSTKNHLSEAQRAELQRALQAQFTELNARLVAQDEGMSQAEHEHEALTQDADDPELHASTIEVTSALSDIENAEFNALVDALKRIQGADYGWCVDCQAPIPFKRLQAEPQALRCADCQTLFERSH